MIAQGLEDEEQQERAQAALDDGKRLDQRGDQHFFVEQPFHHFTARGVKAAYKGQGMGKRVATDIVPEIPFADVGDKIAVKQRESP